MFFAEARHFRLQAGRPIRSARCALLVMCHPSRLFGVIHQTPQISFEAGSCKLKGPKILKSQLALAGAVQGSFVLQADEQVGLYLGGSLFLFCCLVPLVAGGGGAAGDMCFLLSLSCVVQGGVLRVVWVLLARVCVRAPETQSVLIRSCV